MVGKKKKKTFFQPIKPALTARRLALQNACAQISPSLPNNEHSFLFNRFSMQIHRSREKRRRSNA